MYNSTTLNITKYEIEQAIRYINSNIAKLKKTKFNKTIFQVPEEMVQILFIDKYKPLIIEQIIDILKQENIILTYKFVKSPISTSISTDIETNFSIKSNKDKWWITIVLQ